MNTRRIPVVIVALFWITTSCGSADNAEPTSLPAPGSVGSQPDAGGDNSSLDAMSQPASAGVIVSDDARLAITDPAGLGITISPLSPTAGPIPSDLADAGVTPLFSYELGPAGANFDPPLEVRIELDPAEIGGGVVGWLQSSDASVEGVDLTIIEDTPDGLVLSAQIPHFSTFTLGKHTIQAGIFVNSKTVEVGADNLVSLSVVASAGEVPETGRIHPDDLAALAPQHFMGMQVGTDPLTTNDERTVGLVGFEVNPGLWTHSGPVSGQLPGRLLCNAAGGAIVSVDGFVEFGFIRVPFQTVGVYHLDEEEGFECVERTIIKLLDVRCRDAEGIEATACPEVGHFAASGSGESFLLSASSTAPSATSVVTVSIFADDGTGGFLNECDVNGCRGFAAPSFFGYDPGLPVVTEADASGASFGFTLRPSADGPLYDVPGGEASDGTVIEPGPRPMTELVVFVKDTESGLQSTYLLDIADVRDHLGDVP